MRTEEEHLSHEAIPTSWQDGWESVNGNPDVYIFQGNNSNDYLLAYSYNKESGHGSFSCYRVDSDEEGYYIGVGTRQYRLSEEQAPYSLHIGDWGSYMQN